MKNINFNKNNKKVHFIGIGGISMSGLAKILLTQGFEVSGSDLKFSDLTKDLEKLGVRVFLGQRKENIMTDIDLIVYTAAIKYDNEELMEAKDKNITCIERSELLGEIMNNYKYSVGVSGTHGKTTTTSMLSHILLEANTDPTITVGGLLDIINGNIRVGDSDYFLTEACEYWDSFLKFNPFIGVILNIEEDHMDYFKDIEQIRTSFLAYSKKIPDNGYLVINGDIENMDYFRDNLNCSIITIGLNSDFYTFSATNISYLNNIYPCFDVKYKGQILGNIHLSVPGEHNIYNALCAIASGHCLNISFSTIKKGLNLYKGTHKRFEYKGNLKGITIIDDYAHHPTEIKATLKTAMKYPHNKLYCVFQPHTYTRTSAFLEGFADAFKLADTIILADIFAAREKNTGTVHSKDLLNKMKDQGMDSYYFPTFDEIENFLLEKCSPGDLLITIGAGDISIVGEELLNL